MTKEELDALTVQEIRDKIEALDNQRYEERNQQSELQHQARCIQEAIRVLAESQRCILEHQIELLTYLWENRRVNEGASEATGATAMER